MAKDRSLCQQRPWYGTYRTTFGFIILKNQKKGQYKQRISPTVVDQHSFYVETDPALKKLVWRFIKGNVSKLQRTAIEAAQNGSVSKWIRSLGPYTERNDLWFEVFFVKEIRRVIEWLQEIKRLTNEEQHCYKFLLIRQNKFFRLIVNYRKLLMM